MEHQKKDVPNVTISAQPNVDYEDERSLVYPVVAIHAMSSWGEEICKSYSVNGFFIDKKVYFEDLSKKAITHSNIRLC